MPQGGRPGDVYRVKSEKEEGESRGRPIRELREVPEGGELTAETGGRGWRG